MLSKQVVNFTPPRDPVKSNVNYDYLEDSILALHETSNKYHRSQMKLELEFFQVLKKEPLFMDLCHYDPNSGDRLFFEKLGGRRCTRKLHMLNNCMLYYVQSTIRQANGTFYQPNGYNVCLKTLFSIFSRKGIEF